MMMREYRNLLSSRLPFHKYNSITSMAGGIEDQSAVSQATAALYVCFTLFSLVASVPLNMLGPRLTLFLGTLGYTVYVLALLYLKRGGDSTVLIIAGALNGASAALLWTAQGSLCMVYPTASNRGLYLSVFWIIFNSGAVIGSLTTVAANWENEKATKATDATFLAFAGFMTIGGLIPFFMTEPSQVVRADGTGMQKAPTSSLEHELSGMSSIFLDKRMLSLAPLFFYSNFFYTFHFSLYNSRMFTVRTQGFNNCFYWGAQMIGSFVLGRFLDDGSRTIRMRATSSMAALAMLGGVTWVGCWGLIDFGEDLQKIDLSETHRFAAPFLLYVGWGFCDAWVQCWSYWVMANLDSDPAVLARYSGFYKTIQSTGAAVAWGINGSGGADARMQLVMNSVLFVAAIVPSIPIARSLTAPLASNEVEVDLETEELRDELARLNIKPELL